MAQRDASQGQAKGKLNTYQPSVVQEILNVAPSSDDKQAIPTQATISVLSPSTWQVRKAAQRAVLEAQAQAKERAFREAMQLQQAKEAEQRDAAFQLLYSDVLEGLECGSGILAEVQEILDHATATSRARQTSLHQQWSSQVFDKLQGRIQQAVASTSVQQLEAALKASSDDYIHATNTKLGVFRDVIIEADYDPLRPLGNSIRVPTADLVDPLKKDLLKTQAEKALLHTVATSKNSNSNQLATAVTRPTLAVRQWASGQINATPYGHCVDDATAEYIVKVASPADLCQKSSHVYFDDYSAAPASEAYKPSKHMTPPVIKGNRADLFDLMQGRCADKAGATGGDSWLEHKGKKKGGSCELTLGRKGLSEVLQQSSNPYLDGRG